MNRFGIAVHGGAGNPSSPGRKKLVDVENGLTEAILIGHAILKKGGSAQKAVENAVKSLEDNPLFNAGRGSVLNSKGEVEMDASIMDGKTLKAGAVAMIRGVKNPVTLARLIMTDTKHVMLSGYGALEFAISKDLPIEKDSYFVTKRQYEKFIKWSKEKKTHGTVGAVALDKNGNLAAATSTGGIGFSLPGRVGDSCIIGAGCYANNKTCAVSATGEGEYIIREVVANTISMYLELQKCSIQEACDYVIHKRNKKGEMGVIAIDKKGNIGITFNTKIMNRAWVGSDGNINVQIYE